MPNEEILDIVSDDDQVIGSLPRRRVYEEKMTCFRVINGFIINPKKQLWIPTRHPMKKLFPMCLDCSVGGHVKSGENYFQAFVRETLEETGLNPCQVPHKLLSILKPPIHRTSAFMHVYALYWDGLIEYNKEDFIHFEWMSPEYLLSKIQAGTQAKSDLSIILKECFFHA